MTANRGEKAEPAAGRQGGLFPGNARERRGDEAPPHLRLRLPHFCLRHIHQSIETGQKATKKKKKQPILMHKRVGFHLRNC